MWSWIKGWQRIRHALATREGLDLSGGFVLYIARRAESVEHEIRNVI